MTLIAYTLNSADSFPVLVGDILVTSTGGETTNPIPTHKSGTSKFLSMHQKFKPYSLAQKIYVIRENVAIALAGIVDEVKKFLEDFRIYCNSFEVITIQDVAFFLEGYDVIDALPNSTYLISVTNIGSMDWINSEVFVYPDDGTWDLFETGQFGQAFVSGSGKEKFGDLLKNLPPPIEIEELPPVIQAIHKNLSNFARFLALERSHAWHTISELWGAGFEMIFWTGSHFKKLNDFAFIIYVGEYDANCDIGNPLPNLILYNKYVGDDLIITSIDIEKCEQIIDGESNTIISKTDGFSCSSYTVSSIENIVAFNSEEPKELSFQTNNLIIGFATKAKDKVGVIPYVSFNNPGASLKFEMDNVVEYRMTKKIIERLRETANNSYPNRHLK